MSASNESEIVDYAQKDFREYWQGRSKELLDQTEQRIVQSLLPDSGKWFVDIGCGFGRLMPSYQARQKNLVLVDYDIKHLKMAAESTGRENVYFIAADACRLPFRCEVFDSGICVRLLHHIADAEVFMKEAYRIFTKSSCLLLNYMNRRNMLRVCRYGSDCFRHTHERVSEIIFATHPAYYSQLAKDAGFHISSVRGTGLVHQLVHDSHAFAECAEHHAGLSKVLNATEHLADPILGRMNLALMQYTKLEKRHRLFSEHRVVEANDLMGILRCPGCWNASLGETANAVTCNRCGNVYERDGQVYDFRCTDKTKWR